MMLIMYIMQMYIIMMIQWHGKMTLLIKKGIIVGRVDMTIMRRL